MEKNTRITMKQYLSPEQTTKLIELGFEKPKSMNGEYNGWQFVPTPAYSFGELIEILEDVASIVISYSYQKNGYYVRVIIPKREGGGMYRISRIELVDALYDMIIMLKEEGVI